MYPKVTPAEHSSGPHVPPLDSYDSESFGPLFAVSDEGSAGAAVVDAAYRSAKARAFGIDPAVLGVALDGERMTSAGEVPIGPDEYEALREASAGRIFSTTNVGVRTNARHVQLLPEFPVTEDSATDPTWVAKICKAFEPFVRTPDGRPRPLTVRLWLKPDVSIDALGRAIAAIEHARTDGKLGPREIHRLAPLLAFNTRIRTAEQVGEISRLIAASATWELNEVAIDGALRGAARHRLGIQSLLNVLSVEHARQLLHEANAKKIRFCYRYALDVDSAARTIWTGLFAARAHGFSGGKYGLVPMTLEEQAVAIEVITHWCRGWTAIPAFYVDTPLVTAGEIYDVDRAAESARLWLKMARGAGARIVLFDCPDRFDPRKLLRADPSGPNDLGVLTMRDVDDLLAYARDLGVSILWSGGITGRQAFELAKRKVTGVFSTSSTAERIAVSASFERDPFMASENEPTEAGIRRIHAVVQAGFLVTSLAQGQPDLAASIGARAERLLGADAASAAAAFQALDADLEQGWRRLSAAIGSTTPLLAPRFRSTNAVPADAVRVFRGRRRSDLDYARFVDKLGSVFMPITVQMQRLYGLCAYLPAVLPPGSGPELPDEVALVFYNTQGAYHEAKRCVGGRAYSELHDLVFDMPKSPSGFPVLLGAAVDANTPHHLFSKSIDWQSGDTYLFAGKRLATIDPQAFIDEVGARARALQKAPGAIDGVIFAVTKDALIWWEHAPDLGSPAIDFTDIAATALGRVARPVQLPPKLTVPFRGLTLDPAGDFISAQFPTV
jgi:hypothetical protein